VSTEVETTVDAALPAAPRRNVWGRLYHGETSIDFYGKRWWGLAISAVLIVISVLSLVTRNLNLGIDFEGGVAWEVPSDTLSLDEARSVLDSNGVESTNAKIQERQNSSGRSLFIQVGDQPEATRLAVQQAYADQIGQPIEQVSTTSVSATWGEAITNKAIRALLIFLVLVAMFIAWRLEWKMALATIIAMLHDVLISVGIYSLVGFEVTPATVVAFLTILGFSLYDTIVVFDKVRENAARYSGSRVPYADVSNVSMNQVLMRSLNTSLAAILPVLSLLVLGSEILGAVALREFALALLVGLLTGSYSSIFVAAPLLVMFKEREGRFRSLKDSHAVGAELERLVLGGVPSQRSARRSQQVVTADGETGAQPAAARTVTADELLTHAPRPRKKKRRVD
jgi:preprotein translocase subunit SecF